MFDNMKTYIACPCRVIFLVCVWHYNAADVVFCTRVRAKVGDIFQVGLAICVHLPDLCVKGVVAMLYAFVLHQTETRVLLPFPHTSLPVGIASHIQRTLSQFGFRLGSL